MAVTAAHTKQVLWLTYEPSLRRWNAVSTAPEASRDQEHQR
jgi:hypothetical protein